MNCAVAIILKENIVSSSAITKEIWLVYVSIASAERSWKNYSNIKASPLKCRPPY